MYAASAHSLDFKCLSVLTVGPYSASILLIMINAILYIEANDFSSFLSKMFQFIDYNLLHNKGFNFIMWME